MKRILSVIILTVFALALSACWPGEIAVSTTFNADGSGTRYIVIEVMDDLLSSTPIVHPGDPDRTKGKGAVLNDKHIIGGVIAIQTWLTENAPDFITVHEAEVDGYVRIFTMSYDFTSFEDFIEKYKQLVNSSPNLSWNDFDASELPKLETSGGLTKKLTFTESKAIVEASLDWALDGIYTNIYDAANLAGFVDKDSISVLASYSVTINDGQYSELRFYDPTAPDGNDLGKVIFVESDTFTVTGSFINTGLLALVVGGALVAAGGGFLLFKKFAKK